MHRKARSTARDGAIAFEIPVAAHVVIVAVKAETSDAMRIERREEGQSSSGWRVVADSDLVLKEHTVRNRQPRGCATQWSGGITMAADDRPGRWFFRRRRQRGATVWRYCAC